MSASRVSGWWFRSWSFAKDYPPGRRCRRPYDYEQEGRWDTESRPSAPTRFPFWHGQQWEGHRNNQWEGHRNSGWLWRAWLRMVSPLRIAIHCKPRRFLRPILLASLMIRWVFCPHPYPPFFCYMLYINRLQPNHHYFYVPTSLPISMSLHPIYQYGTPYHDPRPG